ncbi:MAG: 3'(2'),5'-bisphosphate nucleotidase [Halomonas sp. 54_146]|nr:MULTISPECIES: 3'(2'),5'-bisphosphate nucleotidase CysQ [unclassified Halomonas]KUJ87091.1 MAG: 3'(2'),5'-bisphosphate nucleotidase [Halomonas sp. 54_146]HAA45201.1 3'(2'),5'-bisphosphate nucleotidase [Halomonas sp.]
MPAITMTLLESVKQLACEAGEAIMQVYQREFSVELKADNSPLTEADKAAHRIIAQGLKTLTPEVPILSEEDTQSFKGANAQGFYWLVDPLDGTKEFIKRNDEFTVNIALIRKGKAVLGVVVAPALQLIYLAAEGHGAFKVTTDGQRKAIHASSPPAKTETWRVLGSRSHTDGRLSAWLGALGKYELQPMGSSLKSCLVAEGKADVYPRFGPTSLWDTGAAQAVVEQAGGRVVTFHNQPLSYALPEHATPEQLLNPDFVVWGGECVNAEGQY